MALRPLTLLVALCLWEGLWGGASVSKVVKRRGVRAHTPAAGENKAVDQWDSSMEGNAVPPVKFSGLMGRVSAGDARLIIHTETAFSVAVAPAARGRSAESENTNPATQPEENPDSNPDSAVHTTAVRSGAALDLSESENDTKSAGPSLTQERNTISPLLRKQPDLGTRGNKTRFRSFVRSRVRPDLTVVTTVAQVRGPPLSDSPRKSDVTENRGPPRESLDRAVQAGPLQRQNGADSSPRDSAGPSNKRDLVTLVRGRADASLSTEPTAEEAVTPDLPHVGSQTAHPDSSPATDSSPAWSVHTHGSPVEGVTPDSRGGMTKAAGSSLDGDASVSGREEERAAGATLTVQSEDAWNTVSNSVLPAVTQEPQGRGNQSSAHGEDPDSAFAPGSTDTKTGPDGSHVLKLRPDPGEEWSVAVETAESGVTVDSWLEGKGLVFEEAEEEEQGQDGAEIRSRSRRSWIWNQFFVIEEYSGPEPVLIGRLHTDMDRGDGRTKYILRGEGAGSVFVIDEKTGNIHVTKPLDREEKDEYRLIATATDRQTERALEPSSQFIIRVQDINDNPPVFQDGPYSATVPEMANIGTSIIQVTATDADDPTYGNSARLVYTLVQGQQYFSVDPQTGILRTAVPDMDRETQDTHLVVLQAKDMGGHLGGLSGTTTVTIRLSDVNDNPPRFTQSVWSFSVSELAMPGVEVGRVSATDADLGENSKLEYSILEGESGDTFNISSTRREAIIILNKPVDYESRSSYSFSVENCPPSCTVGRVSAIDPDTGLSSNVRYSIDPQSDPEALFRIAADSGLITTATELDRERDQWHNLTVIATQRDSPSQVSRVEVAIETLDVNDNAPELDRQYTTALCDSAAAGQVVQVVRAIDKDKGGNDTSVLFSIPPESRIAQNFSIRESGGPTASLVLLSPLPPLSRSPSSSLTLQVPLVLKDSLSGLTSTGTVTVSVCPCLRGGARAGEKDRQTEAEWEREAVCLPMPSSSPSPGLSTAALLAILACVATLMAVSALSLSLRRQKRDSLSPLEEDDVRENIITYDDEGGGEADTAAFDIAALQSAPHSARRGYRTLDSRNIRFPQQSQEHTGAYGWMQGGAGLEPQYAGAAPPLYGRLCYSSHTLPVLRRAHSHAHGLGLAELACNFPSGPLDHSLVIQNQGAILGPLGAGPVYMGPTEPHADRGAPQMQDAPAGLDSTAARGGDMKDRGGASASETEPRAQQDQDWNRSVTLTQPDPSPPSQNQTDALPKDRTLVQTRQGVAGGGARAPSCSSSTLPSSGRQASRAGPSPKQGVASADSSQQGDPQRDYPGTLGRAGLGVGPEGGMLYPEGAGLMTDWRDRAGLGRYPLGRRDMSPQLLPFPGQNRGILGQLGYRGGWGPGPGAGLEAGRGGANSLALRVGEFLRLRLAQVTFDPTQPPYDSVQIYGLEGEGSRAGSLSSLESEGEKEVEKEWGGVVEDWGPQFQKLAELFREREREKVGEEREEEEKKKEGEKEEVEEEEKPGESGKERDSEEK
ncbi:hypothetical protein AGOR_G00032790 [Albula goreensis]|uniref:Cadherin domain-containing protein n=1 Tax=Albula goreensis TaxID=1534307 RepID=A0A8T3DY53_9TELE|nr:hypothetical protein AGOR_G00032790 [Albula goreensis]